MTETAGAAAAVAAETDPTATESESHHNKCHLHVPRPGLPARKWRQILARKWRETRRAKVCAAMEATLSKSRIPLPIKRKIHV